MCYLEPLPVDLSEFILLLVPRSMLAIAYFGHFLTLIWLMVDPLEMIPLLHHAYLTLNQQSRAPIWLICYLLFTVLAVDFFGN
jgi:hypothetical protein